MRVCLALTKLSRARQPFPGPGLAVRLICCDGPEPERPAEQREAVSAFVKQAGEGEYTVCLGPVRSVGVQGDNRSYQSLASLYGTQNLAEIDWCKLMAVAKGIPNAFSFINRVIYCLDGPMQGPIRCEGMHISPDTADLLREIDDIVTRHLMNSRIAQCFAVLFPLPEHRTRNIPAPCAPSVPTIL